MAETSELIEFRRAFVWLLCGMLLPSVALVAFGVVAVANERAAVERRLAEEYDARLRALTPPVICRIDRDQLLLDLRTVLTDQDVELMAQYFFEWSNLVLPTLVPGGHVFIAATPLWSQVVFNALTKAGFEKRGEIVRLVRTLRGGDRPKGAEREFPDVSAMPRSCWEPWGVFRRPFEGTLARNLRRWNAGGLRRLPDGNPFPDVIASGRTPREERDLGLPRVR